MTETTATATDAAASAVEAGGIPSAAYTREYYESNCDGYREFNETRGRVLPRRLTMPLALVKIKPGMRVLDVGCGRGELLVHCARQGAEVLGIDYAQDALDLCAELLAEAEYDDVRGRISIARAGALDLPYPDNSVDVAFMLDVVEHLYPVELQQSFVDIRRVLKPGGKLVVHTMPNLWYYYYGYPVYRALQRLRGERLPANPRERWDYHDVHVNEQTPRTMTRALEESGYRARVWLKSTQSYEYEKNLLVRAGMNLLTRVYPFRPIFCNDIFAVGTKPKR